LNICGGPAGLLLFLVGVNRLHEKGFIEDPVGKAKSVILTEEGLAQSRRLFEKLFAKS